MRLRSMPFVLAKLAPEKFHPSSRTAGFPCARAESPGEIERGDYYTPGHSCSARGTNHDDVPRSRSLAPSLALVNTHASEFAVGRSARIMQIKWNYLPVSRLKGEAEKSSPGVEVSQEKDEELFQFLARTRARTCTRSRTRTRRSGKGHVVEFASTPELFRRSPSRRLNAMIPFPRDPLISFLGARFAAPRRVGRK